MILTRQHVILLHINEIRAVILRDRCMLLLPEGMSTLLQHLILLLYLIRDNETFES